MTNRAPQANAVPCKFVLHIQHIPHRICCFFLCGCCHMSIGIQREAGGEVAEHSRCGFYVNSVLQGNGEGADCRRWREEGGEASGSGRRETSLLRQAKFLPGTANRITFLARGRVHGQQTASGTDVGCCPSR